MKALKEKRVSLRSIFRRSLVILSLLALAFAVGACNDSGDPDPGTGEPPPPVDPPPVETPQKYVKSIQVLKHPESYSFEGAAPNLTGVSAAVTFVEGSREWVEIISEATKFYALPAIVPAVAEPGSRDGVGNDFTVQENYKLYYSELPTVEPVKVYIPGVRAIVGTGTDDELVAADVKLNELEKLYEDQPIKAGGVKLTAKYAAVSASDAPDITTGDYDDYGRTELRFVADPAKEYTLAVSSHPEAWEIRRPTEVDKAYLGTKIVYQFDGLDGGIEVAVKEFHYIDRFTFDKFEGTFEPFFVEDDAFDSDPSSIDWIKLLTDAKPKFNILYYGPEMEPRTIGMEEYIQAMYLLGEDGNARATKPEPAFLEAPPLTPINLVTAAAGEYDIQFRMTYYNPGITGVAGQGVYSGDDEAAWPNTAIVTISSPQIYTFARVVVEPKAGKEGQIPEILGGKYTTEDAARDEVLKRLASYWDVYYIYTLGTEEKKVTPLQAKVVTEDTKDAIWIITPADPGADPDPLPSFLKYADSVTMGAYAQVEEAEEDTITIKFNAPASFSNGTTSVGEDTDDIEFTYRILP